MAQGGGDVGDVMLVKVDVGELGEVGPMDTLTGLPGEVGLGEKEVRVSTRVLLLTSLPSLSMVRTWPLQSVGIPPML